MARRLSALYDRAAWLGSEVGAPAPILATARLELRPLRRSDAGLLAHHAGQARVARMTSTIPHPYPPGAAAAFVERAASGARGAAWAIDGSRSGLPELVGTIEMRRPGADGCEIGYWIAPPFWNDGLATEAVRAVLAADPLDCPRTTASVFRDNPASARVLEAAGFERVGEAQTFSVARGEAVASWIYARTADDAA